MGGMAPYNFTPSVWVDARDEEAVEQRWQELENAYIDDIPSLFER